MPSKVMKKNDPVVGLETRARAPGVFHGPEAFETVAFVTQQLGEPFIGWCVRAEFDLDREAGEVLHRSITFEPSDRIPLGSLSQTALRRLTVLDAFQAIEDVMRQFEALGNEEAEGWVDALTAGRRPGRRGQDPYVYIVWAQRRIEAESQAPGRPIDWLVEQYGGEPHKFTKQAINKYVFTAREKGFLTPAGETPALTPRAQRLLKKVAK